MLRRSSLVVPTSWALPLTPFDPRSWLMAAVFVSGLTRLMQSTTMAAARQRLAPHLGEMNVIRVDRLDPSKNQLIGFRAFARLLEMRPDLRRRVRCLAFLIPSRTDLGIYR